MQLTYAFIYHMEFDFFERYKVLEGEWPWKEDKDYWWEYLMPKSCVVYFVNMLILAPLSYGMHELFGVPLNYGLSRDGIPNASTFVA